MFRTFGNFLMVSYFDYLIYWNKLSKKLSGEYDRKIIYKGCTMAQRHLNVVHVPSIYQVQHDLLYLLAAEHLNHIFYSLS